MNLTSARMEVERHDDETQLWCTVSGNTPARWCVAVINATSDPTAYLEGAHAISARWNAVADALAELEPDAGTPSYGLAAAVRARKVLRAALEGQP